MTATVSTEGLPDDLHSLQPLWEIRELKTPNQAESISRLYQDGRLFVWSDTRRRFVNGQLRRETAPYEWRLDAQIRPEGVEKVRELIRAEFQQLSENTSLTLGFDQGVVVHRSYLDGVEHTVSVPAGPTDELPQVLRDIDDAIALNISPGAVPVDQ